MKRAINEIQGMVLKAARGAGVPLGIAEDLSDCVPFVLAENGLGDIAEILSRDNHALLIGDIAIIDAQICGLQRSDALHMPLRLLHALCAARGLETKLVAVRGSHSVDEAQWAQLARLAALTYVPATEASRTSGAGAGISDND